MPVTRRQKQILDFLTSYRTRHGYSPSIEEIRDHLGLSAVSTVHRHLQNMVAEGLITREKHRTRSAAPRKGGEAGSVEVPLLGMVAAGVPIEACPVPETVTLPEDLVRGEESYALRVRGDSMIEDGILEGDTIIVERRETARDGEVVVALVGGAEVTVKRWFREGRLIRLQPANAAMEPILVDESEVRIQGVVVGLMRKFN
jgi:repressor LexA